MKLNTVEITNEHGATRVVNERDLELWRSRGYYIVGEEPVEVVEEPEEELEDYDGDDE